MGNNRVVQCTLHKLLMGYILKGLVFFTIEFHWLRFIISVAKDANIKSKPKINWRYNLDPNITEPMSTSTGTWFFKVHFQPPDYHYVNYFFSFTVGFPYGSVIYQLLGRQYPYSILSGFILLALCKYSSPGTPGAHRWILCSQHKLQVIMSPIM